MQWLTLCCSWTGGAQAYNAHRVAVLQVAKQSNAARSMCLWVRALDTYSKVVRVVEPKRQALQEAETALQVVEEQLAATRAQLR